MKTYDLSDDHVVVVIGSGAGGGTVSNELAQQGVDVVCLEAGSRLSLAEIINDPETMDERIGWNDTRYGYQGVWICKTVGGTTVRWSGITPRFLAHEFEAKSAYGLLDDTTLIDWPLSLYELQPYYVKAEAKMGVAGTHGIPVYPEMSNYLVLRTGAEKIGYRQLTTARTAINPVARDGRPGCQRLGFCNSGCAIGAKWSTLYTEIPKAEATGHFELRPNAMALQILHDGRGRVESVLYVDAEGRQQRQKARAVCVAGNVVETTRLLLNSASPMFPHGLANSSGHVGRNYMIHMTAGVHAILPGEVKFHHEPRQTGIISDEHLHDPHRDFAGGYLFETSAGTPADVAERVGGWGSKAARFVENYRNLAAVFLVGEDPPQASNRIRLHESDKDEQGLPVPVIEYTDHPNTIAMRRHAVRQATAIYESLNALEIVGSDETDTTGGCHNMGVARMSADPADGVCNRWGRAHDIPNLFVSDGSLFPTSAAPNPTLTITALAIRQAEHIGRLMARREL